MVEAVRGGASMRSAARRWGVSLPTVRRWVDRARGCELDEVDWSSRPSIPHRTHRTETSKEDRVLSLRYELRNHSDLGEFGAAAIQREWLRQGLPLQPSVRTIGRILERRGVLDARRRIRRPPPPLGWYLPRVASGHAELDSFDVVEGLVIEGGTQVEVLNGISLHGGLPASWPLPIINTDAVIKALVEHWRAFGLPSFAQFDNDTLFQGPHQHPDTIGRVIRLCVSLNIIPVFAPPRETGFQAAVESFNARWQAKVWVRFHHDSLTHLQDRSARYIQAYRRQAAPRIETAPHRRPFPLNWKWELKRPIQTGQIIYLRHTNDHGNVNLLGHTFEVHSTWPHRLVRCEVNLKPAIIHFYALRRRDPNQQPLLHQIPYALKQKWLSR